MLSWDSMTWSHIRQDAVVNHDLKNDFVGKAGAASSDLLQHIAALCTGYSKLI